MMNSLIGTLGATVISGYLILMMIHFNTNVSSANFEILNSNISQEDAIETGKVLEFDLYKIGFKVTGEKIQIADSLEIKYFADFNNDDVIDSIRYYVGNTSELNHTSNPDDRPLYRKVNANPANAIGAATDFNFAYLDSTGSQISYASLSNASVREKIKSLRILVGIEAAEPVNSVYHGVDFFRIIRPKNLIN
jgi:hypothetical protein